MKALSLHQPYVRYIVLDGKRVETRDWGTPFRGEVAIHAAKTRVSVDEDSGNFPWCLWAEAKSVDPGRVWRNLVVPGGWNFGCVQAVATLSDCVKVFSCRKLATTLTIYHAKGSVNVSHAEAILGDLSPGRFAWLLSDIRVLRTPVPVRGRQGLFDLAPEDERAVRAQLERAVVDWGGR